ncbi:MAG: VTT domain-containing protein [Candidatus Diapherotrites archaeon]
MDLSFLLNDLLRSLGLVGLFLASLIANAAIFLVTPIDVIVVIAGSIGLWHPVVIGIVAGLGGALGEMTSYFIGLGGIKLVEKRFELKTVFFDYVRKRLDKWGSIFIFFASVTPFPFDFVGIVAGLIKYDWRKFFIAMLAGKIIKYALLAYAGFTGIKLLKLVFLERAEMQPVFLAGLALLIILIAGVYYLTKREVKEHL